MKRLVIASDHHGFNIKRELLNHTQFKAYTVSWIDVGSFDTNRVDYPAFAARAVQELRAQRLDGAVLLCGTGAGMAIAANRFKGIYAGVAWNEEIAQRIKAEDNTNVLVIPADFVSATQTINLIATWISTPFEGGRYAERLKALDTLPT